MEHFAQARENYQNGHYTECTSRLKRAIHGDKTSPGWEEDYRFYQLAGTLYLECLDRSLIDLPEAEKCFRKAARYARAKYPYEAAGSLVAAGVAAYSHGRMTEALQYEQEAYSLIAKLGEAYFQAAKVLVHLRKFDLAFQRIRNALDCDIHYARRLPEDGEFERNAKDISPFWQAIGHEARQSAESLRRDVEASLARINQWRGMSVHETDYRDAFRKLRSPRFAAERAVSERAYNSLHAETNAARTHYENAVDAAKAGTVYGYLEAVEALRCAVPRAASAETQIRQIEGLFQQVRVSAKKKLRRLITYVTAGSCIGFIVGGIPVWMIIGICGSQNAGAISSTCTWTWLLTSAATGGLTGWGLGYR